MIGFLKVATGTAFLMTIVLVPVVVFSLLFLALTAEKDHESSTKDRYVTLLAYQESKEEGVSDVVDEVFISCQKNGDACKQVKEVFRSSCSLNATKNPRILASGSWGERAMISAECPKYKDLEGVMLEAQS